jgi:hypothetical protein
MRSGTARYCMALAGFFAFVLVGTLSATTAKAANLFELNFYMSGPKYDGDVPPCDHPSALDKVAARFGDKEGQFWNTNLRIAGFEKIRQTAWRPGPPHTIPRRFCTAVALVTDGLKHPIHYSIGENTGLLGTSWGVEWCVEGLDRNWAFNPACKMARP